jgi:hypothetical protein
MARHDDLKVSAAAVLVLACATATAQPTTRRIFVSGTSGSGSPVLDLQPSDLEIRENGVRREVLRVAPGSGPMRIALLVDSSGAVAPLLNNIRAGLRAFLDTLAGDHEIVFLSTGGQLRIRQPPTRDRDKLRAAAALFASDGGANAFLDSLTETYSRFLSTPLGVWPVLVMLTTDSGETWGEPNIDRFNRFVNGFAARAGTAHAIVVHGRSAGITTDFAMNVVENTGGYYESMSIANVLPDKMRALAAHIDANHRAVANWFEVEYEGGAEAASTRIGVGTTREGVRLQMSTRRPF